MPRLPTGQRIAQRRRERGMTQVALAREAGISASYLNLIEHDKRMIGGALLRRIATTLGAEIGHLSGSNDDALAQDLVEMARQLPEVGLDQEGALELVSRQPAWARAFVRLHRAYRDAREAGVALSDRLNRDPALMELSHAVLTEVTAVRSFAEILQQHEDLSAEERARFSAIIAGQSERLGVNAREMIALLGGTGHAPRPATPGEEVDDFIIFHRNHFPALEDAADRLRASLLVAGSELGAALAERLGGAAPAMRDGVPAATRRFRMARRLALGELSELLDALIEDERLTSPEARRGARGALAGYAAGALLFPYEPFLDAAETLRYDIERLAARFDGSFEQAAHRLVTLRRPDAEGIPFAFLRTDAGGNLSKPFSIPGLRMPRFSGACPLWAVYAALAQPERTVAQLAVFPDGDRHLFVARRVVKRAAAYGAIAPLFAVMLGCDAAYLDRLVYGDAFAGGRDTLATPVGFTCRSCVRAACPQRARPSILRLREAADTGAGPDGADER